MYCARESSEWVPVIVFLQCFGPFVLGRFLVYCFFASLAAAALRVAVTVAVTPESQPRQSRLVLGDVLCLMEAAGDLFCLIELIGASQWPELSSREGEDVKGSGSCCSLAVVAGLEGSQP